MTFEGVFNFRDLGGHRTSDGLTVRSGLVFRADDLSKLTDADQKAFTELGIRTVIDLRRPHEVEQTGRIADFGGFDYHNLHLVHPKWEHRQHPDTADRIDFLNERYAEMSSQGGEAIGTALRYIADPAKAPVVFHCLAGKDRTGIVAGLTLSLLGVPDADVAEDYHRSDLAEGPAWARYAAEHGFPTDNPRAHIQVSPRVVMLNLLTSLRARHGSIAAYAETLGVTPSDIAAMRTHLLTS